MRYIDADKLKDIKFNSISNDKYGIYRMGWNDAIDAVVDNEPTADVRENVKAHWIDMKPTGDSRFMCSRCKWKEKVPTIMGEPIVWDYCPSCGAYMRSES